MKVITVLVGALIVGLSAPAASALTIINKDDRSYRLQIIQGDRTSEVEIGPGAEVDDLCQEPCQVTLEGDPEPYELEIEDVIQIEDGQLYFADESPEPPTQGQNQ
ncbi:MAG: hypothetical protein ACFCUN_08250 [Hyphomicrobiaceae bacterium]